MEPVTKITETTPPTVKMKPSTPRAVTMVTLQAEALWPAKTGHDLQLDHRKFPKLKMLHVPQDQMLYLQWHDGSIFGIPTSNVKGMVYEAL